MFSVLQDTKNGITKVQDTANIYEKGARKFDNSVLQKNIKYPPRH